MNLTTIAPIFLLKTRSFWFGIFPILLTLVDTMFSDLSAGGTGGPLAEIIANVTGHGAADIQSFLLKLTPVWGLIIAQQRSGMTRPYTLDPKKEQVITRVVEDGKSAFEAGKAIGAALKKAR